MVSGPFRPLNLGRSPAGDNKYERKQDRAHVEPSAALVSFSIAVSVEVIDHSYPTRGDPHLGSRSARLMLHCRIRRKCKIRAREREFAAFAAAARSCFRDAIVSKKRQVFSMTSEARCRRARWSKAPPRAPARAMLHAAGFDDEALAKPLIAIVNNFSTVTPCNMHLRDLAEHAGPRHRGGGRDPDRLQHDRRHRRRWRWAPAACAHR